MAGVRFSELKKLTWELLFRVAGHIEINVSKSKTRSRRLVTVVPSLEQWLAPYQQYSGPLWTGSRQDFHDRFASLLDLLKIPHRSNGLRHGFVSYHLALHANENLTAMESGNSPQVIHEHYKGLATKAEAEKWFAVAPAKAENVVLMTAGGMNAESSFGGGSISQLADDPGCIGVSLRTIPNWLIREAARRQNDRWQDPWAFLLLARSYFQFGLTG